METKFKCAGCGKEIDHVFVYSECYQRASIDARGVVSEYGPVIEIAETVAIQCPSCSRDLYENNEATEE